MRDEKAGEWSGNGNLVYLLRRDDHGHLVNDVTVEVVDCPPGPRDKAREGRIAAQVHRLGMSVVAEIAGHLLTFDGEVDDQGDYHLRVFGERGIPRIDNEGFLVLTVSKDGGQVLTHHGAIRKAILSSDASDPRGSEAQTDDA